MTGSWRTSTLGILGIISGIIAAATSLLDGNPATNPDWTTLVTSITASIGLLMARDNKVTSEEVGAGK